MSSPETRRSRQVSGVLGSLPNPDNPTSLPGCWRSVQALVSPHCTIFRPSLYSWLDHEVFFANQLKEKVS